MQMRIPRAAVVFAALSLLTACGDDYKAVKTTTVFPYGNIRTAGSGVEYVRENLMPSKALKVEAPAAAVVSTPSTMEPESPVDDGHILRALESDMDKIFEESQRK